MKLILLSKAYNNNNNNNNNNKINDEVYTQWNLDSFPTSRYTSMMLSEIGQKGWEAGFVVAK